LLNGAAMKLVVDAKNVAVRAGPAIFDIAGISRAHGKTAEKLTVTAVRPAQ